MSGRAEQKMSGQNECKFPGEVGPLHVTRFDLFRTTSIAKSSSLGNMIRLFPSEWMKPTACETDATCSSLLETLEALCFGRTDRS